MQQSDEAHDVFARGFKTWCEKTALRYRRELRLQDVDPLDPRRLASSLGIDVWLAEDVPGVDPDDLAVLLHEDPDSWSAVTVQAAGRRVVILNSAHSGGRPASDLTHELSHEILGHVAARVDVSEDGLLLLDSYDRQQEDEANWLTGCLLLPRDALLDTRRRGLSVAEIAEHYFVSADMVAYRLNVTGVEYQMAHGKRSKQRR
jgi:hypothetical protein